MKHVPVLCREAVAYLNVKPSGIYVDATLGGGGHAKMILDKLAGGVLLGMDCDRQALEDTGKNLSGYGERVLLKKGNFSEIDKILTDAHLKKMDGILFDLGVSSMQIDEPGRGFSFRREGPLDMRMDRESRLTAETVVNTYPEEELEKIIREYGEEPAARRIAAAIVGRRDKGRIASTVELAELIAKKVPRRGRIDPATKTFQALRIEVNGELSSLSAALEKLPSLLNGGGRLVVISYHSLEDRIVKNFLKKYGETFTMLTKKPVTPSEQEVAENPRSRSAKLRAAERK